MRIGLDSGYSKGIIVVDPELFFKLEWFALKLATDTHGVPFFSWSSSFQFFPKCWIEIELKVGKGRNERRRGKVRFKPSTLLLGHRPGSYSRNEESERLNVKVGSRFLPSSPVRGCSSTALALVNPRSVPFSLSDRYPLFLTRSLSQWK